MDRTRRIIRYVLQHLFSNPRYFFAYALNYFNPNYVPKINYYELEEVVAMLKQGKSIIRIGDGEVYIMNGGSIGYQEFSPQLQSFLFEMIRTHAADSPYTIFLNTLPIRKSNSQLRRDGLLNCWLPMKVYWHLYFNKCIKYADACLFYYNNTFPDYFEAHLKTKKLILVTNKINIEKFKNNKAIPFSNVSFVETPATNAFSVYDQIKREVYTIIKNYKKGEVIVLAACGPTSKPLAYDLSRDGVVTIDVGRGIEVAYTDERIDHIIYPVSK